MSTAANAYNPLPETSGSGAQTGTGASSYLYGDISPSANDYSSMFGGIPGQLSVPASIQQELNANVPGYSTATGTAMSDVQSQLNGQLSASTMMNIGNYAASRGIALGQPNSSLSNEIGLSTTGNTSENLVNTGIGNYNQLSNTLGNEQINPTLTAEIEQQNSVDAAAPNPQQAAWYQQALATALARTSPAGKAGSGYQTALSDISGMLGIVGSIAGMVGGGMGGSGGGMSGILQGIGGYGGSGTSM